jgi:hypothetical protein
VILTRLMGLLSFLGVEGSFDVARDDQGIANWVAAGGRSALDFCGLRTDRTGRTAQVDGDSAVQQPDHFKSLLSW